MHHSRVLNVFFAVVFLVTNLPLTASHSATAPDVSASQHAQSANVPTTDIAATVDITDDGFDPAHVTIQVGDTVAVFSVTTFTVFGLSLTSAII